MIHQSMARVVRERPKTTGNDEHLGSLHVRVAQLGGNVFLQIGFFKNTYKR